MLVRGPGGLGTDSQRAERALQTKEFGMRPARAINAMAPPLGAPVFTEPLPALGMDKPVRAAKYSLDNCYRRLTACSENRPPGMPRMTISVLLPRPSASELAIVDLLLGAAAPGAAAFKCWIYGLAQSWP